MKGNPIKRRSRGAQLPTVLPQALEALREAAGFSSWEVVAREMKRRERRHPEFHVGASADTWRNLIKNDGTAVMRYARLELLEGVTGIPTGIILDVSGSMALLRDGTRKDDAIKYAQGLRCLADAIENEAHHEKALDVKAQKQVMGEFYRTWQVHGIDLSMPVREEDEAG